MSSINRFFSATLFLLIAPLLKAGPITLSLDQPDGRYYSTDDAALLSIEIDPTILAQRKWQKSISWQRNWTGEPEKSEFMGESFSFPLADEKPGQVIFTISLTADDDSSLSHQSSIGLLFEPEAIRLSTPEPADFDQFWETQKRNWRAKKQKVSLERVDSDREDVLAWDLQIKIEGEKPVSGYLALPENANPGTLPAILFLHGAGVRSSILSGPSKAAENGFIALDINAHGLPNGKPADFYRKESETALSGYPRHGFESRDNWYFLKMYLRVVSAIDYLTSRPEWNGQDLVLYGSSQGGGQAIAGAGLDQRVSVVAASVPALCDLTGEPNRKPGWPQPGNVRTLDDETRPQVLKTAGYFDGGLFARRIKAPAILSLGLADTVCPAVGIQALINNLDGPVEAVYRPEMGHAFPGDLKETFDQFVLRQLSTSSAETTAAP